MERTDPMEDGFNATARTHQVVRTSPKGSGQKFIGRCALCGKTGLPADAALEPCDNPAGVTVGGSILDAIAPRPTTSDEWEAVANFLWRLLDNIDTASDMAKDNDKAYRDYVEREQRKRFEVGSTDGYEVRFSAEKFKDHSGGPNPTPQEGNDNG